MYMGKSILCIVKVVDNGELQHEQKYYLIYRNGTGTYEQKDF